MQRRHVLAGIPAVLAACAAPPPSSPGTYEGQHNPLVGQHVDTLVDTYGEPDWVLEMGSGRRAYVYRLGKFANPEDEPCNDAYVVNIQGTVVNYYCR